MHKAVSFRYLAHEISKRIETAGLPANTTPWSSCSAWTSPGYTKKGFQTPKKNCPLDAAAGYHPRLGADGDGIAMNNTADLWNWQLHWSIRSLWDLSAIHITHKKRYFTLLLLNASRTHSRLAGQWYTMWYLLISLCWGTPHDFRSYPYLAWYRDRDGYVLNLYWPPKKAIVTLYQISMGPLIPHLSQNRRHGSFHSQETPKGHRPIQVPCLAARNGMLPTVDVFQRFWSKIL